MATNGKGKGTKNPRRGRLKGSSAPGEPAVFEGGADAAPPLFDPESVAEELRLFWEEGAGEKFLLELEPGVWSEWGERKVLKQMRLLETRLIALKARENERLSEADRVLMHVMRNRRVSLSMPALAGYSAGLHDLWGDRVVVRSSPRLVSPEAGEWPVIGELIEGLLGADQAVFFHGWLKVAVEALYRGGPENFRPGQCCVFAGPANSGKSRLQHQIVTGLLGGRSADPGSYMFGRTDFNSEMFWAEHLLIEDPVSSTLTKDRVFFGEMIKGLVVNDTHRLHRKREDAMTVAPFWRLTISINDDPDKMRVLPLLTPDMKDKVMLFHVHRNPLPMPTESLAERAAFRAAIEAELPAYAAWLLDEFEIPADLRSTRFGVKEWQDPGLAVELFDDTPAAELLMLIDAAVFSTAMSDKVKLWELDEELNSAAEGPTKGQVWRGKALDLERLLLGVESAGCSVEREAKKLFGHNKCDRLLGRLREDQPGRVDRWRTKHERGWLIQGPPS